MALLQSKDCELRVYSGDATPFYVIGRFIQPTDPIPGSPPRPAERSYLDRGVAGAFTERVAEDDIPILDPVPFTLNFLLNEALLDMITALSNPDVASPWSVFGDTWTPVTAIGTRVNGRGAAFTCPLPADSVRRSHLVNIYWRFQAPPGGGNDRVQRLLGCAVDNYVINQDPPVLRVTWTGACYGAMASVATFPAGTESAP